MARYHEEHIAALVASIPQTVDTTQQLRDARLLSHLALKFLKTPDAYQTLVDVAKKCPQVAGLIYDRMLKVGSMGDYIFKVADNAEGYLSSLEETIGKGQPGNANQFLALTKLAALNAAKTLELLSVFKFAPDHTVMNEREITKAMSDIASEHVGLRDAAIEYILDRNSNEAYKAAAATLLTPDAQHFYSEDIAEKVIEKLGQTKAATIAEERLICGTILTIGENYACERAAMVALVGRRTEISYEKIVEKVDGRDEDYFKDRLYSASLAIELIHADIENANDFSLSAVSGIAKSADGYLDAEARAYFAEQGSKAALTHISNLYNQDDKAPDFMEKTGGLAAIPIWEKRADYEDIPMAETLTGLLTLRFNVAQKGETNLAAYDDAVRKVSFKLCSELFNAASSNDVDLDAGDESPELVCGHHQIGDDVDWAKELNEVFSRVQKEVGYAEPLKLLEGVVLMENAKKALSKYTSDMDQMLDDMRRDFK